MKSKVNVGSHFLKLANSMQIPDCHTPGQLNSYHLRTQKHCLL